MGRPYYPCCHHCRKAHGALLVEGHAVPCREGCREADPYLEAATANPERRNNGCMVYRGGE